MPCTDHPYHLGLIHGIRHNGHRFLTEYPNIIGEKNFAYPQLLHWILSFLPKSFLNNHYSVVGIILNNLSLVLFLVYATEIFYFTELNTSLNYFILYAGLIYCLTPFSWAIWNAKNSGISARGLGLFLGYAYQFLTLLYFYSENWTILLSVFIIVFITLLSSQFAFQYILLTLPLYAILYENYYLLAFPFLAFIMFYIINKEIAFNYFRGQYWHKTIYYRYLAKVYIHKMRPSIWRDFIYDIWIQIIKELKRGILYAYGNPVISITVAIPALSYLIFHYWAHTPSSLAGYESILFTNILIILIVFILTSFRPTRFLGEPERYVEFAIPSIVLLTIIVAGEDNSSLNIILACSCVLIAFQFAIQFLKNKKHYGVQLSNLYQRVVEVITEITKDHPELRIFSNNHQILKAVLDTNANVLLTNLTSFNTGSYSFTDIFPDRYGKISEKVIVGLIKEFDIDCFILDPQKYNAESIPHFEEIKYTKYYSNEDFTIYLKSSGWIVNE